MAVTINADTTNGVVITSDTTGEIKLQSAGADIATVSSTGIAMASGKTISGSGAGGKILQVVSTTKTDTFSTSSTSYTNVTGFSASITPSSASNKILVFVNTTGGVSNGGYSVYFNLTRGGTSIYIGDSRGSSTRASSNSPTTASNTAESIAFQFLDSPSTTSSTTYQIQVSAQSGTSAMVGGSYDSNSAVCSSTPSTITLIEVAG